MKKVVALLVLVFCMTSFAEFSLGINLSTRLQNDHRDDNQVPSTVRNDNSFDFSVFPSLIIAPSDFVEFVPFGGFFVSRTWGDVESDGNVTGEYETTNWGFGFGMGLFFRLITRDVIRLSLGPELSTSFWWNEDNWDGYNLGLSAPVNIDLLFSDRFFVRMSSSIASLNVQLVDPGEDRDRRIFSTSVDTRLVTSLGFFFTF